MQFPDHHGPHGPDGSHADREQGIAGSGGFGTPESYLPPPPSPADAQRMDQAVDALLALSADQGSAGIGGQPVAAVPDWLQQEHSGTARPANEDHPTGGGWPGIAPPEPGPSAVAPAPSSPEPAAAPPPPPVAAAAEAVPGDVEPQGEIARSEEEMQDVPLGTLIYRAGLLGAAELEQALEESVTAGKRLGEVLLDRGMIAERDLGRLLAGQKGLQFVELAATEIDPEAARLLPASSARVYGAIPIRVERGVPVVAVADPTNGIVVEGVRRALGDPTLVVASRSDLQNAIARTYAIDGDAPADEFDAAAPFDGAVPPPAALETPAELTPAAPPALGEIEPRQAPAVDVQEPGGYGDAAGDPVLAAQLRTVSDPQPPPSPAAAAVPHQQLPPPPVVTADEAIRVVVSLANGERVELGVFETPERAIASARELARTLDQQEPGDWPLIGNRLLRPGTIDAIELLEERPRY